MDLEKEVEITEVNYRKVRQIGDLPRLKKVIRQGLDGFEELIASMPAPQRETSYALYLERIRAITFSFHLAVLKENAKRTAREGPEEPAALAAALQEYGQELRRISRLYEYL